MHRTSSSLVSTKLHQSNPHPGLTIDTYGI